MNKALIETTITACHRFVDLADDLDDSDYDLVRRGLGSTATAALRRQAIELGQLLDKLRRGR